MARKTMSCSAGCIWILAATAFGMLVLFAMSFWSSSGPQPSRRLTVDGSTPETLQASLNRIRAVMTPAQREQLNLDLAVVLVASFKENPGRSMDGMRVTLDGMTAVQIHEMVERYRGAAQK